jgi:hypoxanthine phosphoribosyltransferase
MKTGLFKRVESLNVFVKLVENLGEKLATYDTILSDDASGRLVSLVLRKVINEARKSKGVEGGVRTYFLAVGEHGHKISDEIKKFIQTKKPEIKKVLVVTEYIDSGKSIGKIIDILDDLNFNFDIATLSLSGKLTSYKHSITNRLYYGESNSVLGVTFWGNNEMTGVKKGVHDISPHPVKKEIPNLKEIDGARQDVNKLAEELKKLI